MKKIGLVEVVVFAAIITLGVSQTVKAAVPVDTSGATVTVSGDALTVKCTKVGEKYFNGTWTLNQTNWGYDLTSGVEDPTCETNFGTQGSLSTFVWKPASDSDGRLVVLLPSSYTNGTQRDLKVYSASNALLETGSYVGPSNGNRETYRFNNHGSNYGDNLTVVIILTDGTKNFWSIPSGGSRYAP